MEFIKDGKTPISNQACEQAIRPFVITAIYNHVNPYMYFIYILKRLPNIDLKDKDQLRELLPYSSGLPEYTKKLSQKECERIIKQNDMSE